MGARTLLRRLCSTPKRITGCNATRTTDVCRKWRPRRAICRRRRPVTLVADGGERCAARLQMDAGEYFTVCTRQNVADSRKRVSRFLNAPMYFVDALPVPTGTNRGVRLPMLLMQTRDFKALKEVIHDGAFGQDYALLSEAAQSSGLPGADQGWTAIWKIPADVNKIEGWPILPLAVGVGRYYIGDALQDMRKAFSKGAANSRKTVLGALRADRNDMGIKMRRDLSPTESVHCLLQESTSYMFAAIAVQYFTTDFEFIAWDSETAHGWFCDRVRAQQMEKEFSDFLSGSRKHPAKEQIQELCAELSAVGVLAAQAATHHALMIYAVNDEKEEWARVDCEGFANFLKKQPQRADRIVQVLCGKGFEYDFELKPRNVHEELVRWKQSYIEAFASA